MRPIILALLLIAGSAGAQTLIVLDQNYNDLPSPDLYAPPGTVRLTVSFTDGANPLNITQGFVRAPLFVVDASGYTQQTVQAVTTNQPGQLRWIFTAPPVGTNRLYSVAQFVDSSLPIFDSRLFVTSAPPSGGGAVIVSNTMLFAGPLTATDGTMRVQGNQIAGYDIGVVGGGGSSLAVYDFSGGVVRAATTGMQFSSAFIITTNEFGVFVGRTDMGGFPTNFSGTNVATYAPNWTDATPTRYYHVCSATTTQVTLHVWGAGASWPGGYTVTWLAHPSALKLKTLTIEVGQGGYASSNAVAGVLYEVPGGWPDGGAALVRSNAVGISGAGSSRVWDGTNLVAVAGAGGTSYNAAGPAYGSGGGSQAGSLAPSSHSGQGGSQTNGGAVATTLHATYVRTNSAGSYMTAGRPGWATNVASSAVFCDGAGGGYYGGGGGLAFSSSQAGGGGGSGWWNPTLEYVYGGDTSRGSGIYPPKTEYEHYIAGRGQAIAARSHGSWGGHGLIIVEER